MENIIAKFLDKPSPLNGYILLHNLRIKNLHHLVLYIGKFLSELYHLDRKIYEEMAISAFYSKNYELSYNLYSKNLEYHNLTEAEIKHTRINRHYSINYIANLYTYYNVNKIKQIIKKKLNPTSLPLITLTITSCKRLDLFKQTINSFINCCEDIDRIDRWICVDDNSSLKDRDEMKRLYPFFDFYWKKFQEKGHPQSMNIIRKIVSTPYIFHMEDDWKFFAPKKYIEECMDVLNSNNNIGQCLINRNYAETATDVHICGGELHRTSKNIKYYIHEQMNSQEFFQKYGNKTNSAYWPHFSLRPSMLKKEVFDSIGEFNENISHFEMDYCLKYVKKYKSAFLDGINCLHIGRLTSQRDNRLIPNAYELNNEKQFGGKEKSVQFCPFPSYLINLKYRKDRLEKFRKLCPLKFEVFKAIEGKKLIYTSQLGRIFEKNDYNMRRGMVGCALSHIKLMINLVNGNEDKFCIFEDDVTFASNFSDKIKKVLSLSSKIPWDIIFLGHTLYPQYKNNMNNNQSIHLEKWSVERSLSRSMGGAFAYLITKKGAEKMLNYINENSMINCIDTMQQKAIKNMNTYYCYPHLVHSDVVPPRTNGKITVDSNIQYDYSSISITPEKQLSLERLSMKGEIIDISSEENLIPLLKNSKRKKIIFYTGKLQNYKENIPNSYRISNTLIILPYYNNRLKKDGKWDITDAIIYK
jgi:GR25 family glycosyltransferase involved in LPS biosynthesis